MTSFHFQQSQSISALSLTSWRERRTSRRPTFICLYLHAIPRQVRLRHATWAGDLHCASTSEGSTRSKQNEIRHNLFMNFSYYPQKKSQYSSPTSHLSFSASLLFSNFFLVLSLGFFYFCLHAFCELTSYDTESYVRAIPCLYNNLHHVLLGYKLCINLKGLVNISSPLL